MVLVIVRDSMCPSLWLTLADIAPTTYSVIEILMWSVNDPLSTYLSFHRSLPSMTWTSCSFAPRSSRGCRVQRRFLPWILSEIHRIKTVCLIFCVVSLRRSVLPNPVSCVNDSSSRTWWVCDVLGTTQEVGFQKKRLRVNDASKKETRCLFRLVDVLGWH